jgi:hypothetical protein
MVGIILFLIFLALTVLALFFGHDSRESVRSKEAQFASLGMSWVEDQVDQQQLADELAAALRTVGTAAVSGSEREATPSLPSVSTATV